MIQIILVVLIFVAAVAYLGRMVYRSFRQTTDDGCAGECKCDSKAQLTPKP